MITKRISNFFLVRSFPYEIFCLIFVGIFLYWGSLDNSFQFDDKQNIWNNSNIQISELSFDELKRAGLESYSESRPVSNISFALNYYVHGLKVRGFHVFNICVHILSAVFLFYFVKITMDLLPGMRCYGQKRLIPFFTALIWLANPVQTQSVTYIVQRMGSMGAMFFILALLLYARGRISPRRVKKIMFFTGAFLTGILAFGSKENTITLPVFILLYEWYFFQDLRLNISWKHFFWITIVVFMMASAVLYSLGTSPLDTLVSGYDTRPFTMLQRLLTEPRVILHYISIFIYPLPGRLNLDYDFHISSSLFFPLTTIFSILTIIGLLGWAVYSARDKRLYSFCVIWFLGNLMVESTFIPLEIVYEHRIYIPSMLGILPLVMFLSRMLREKIMYIALMLVLTIIFSYWTINRNKVWQDELTLWADSQKKSPSKARTNLNLGATYLDRGNFDESIPVLENGLQLYMHQIKFQKKTDRFMTSYYFRNLGRAYIKKRNYQKAIIYFQKSLYEIHDDADTHFSVGLCFYRSKNIQKAFYHFSKAVELSENKTTLLRDQEKVSSISRAYMERTRKMLH